MTQPSVAGIIDLLQTQVVKLSRKIDVLGSQSNNTPNYYHPGVWSQQHFSWNNNQDHFYAPSQAYPLGFQTQHPPQQNDTSNLEDFLTKYIVQDEERRMEELLTKFIEQNEVRMSKQEASIRNLENQMGQLATAIINHMQSILPNDTEINPKIEGKEQCKVDTQESGEKLHEVVGKQQKRTYPNMEDDIEIVKKKIKNESEEMGDQEVPFEVFETINIPSGREECYWVNVVKADIVNDENDEGSYFLPMDEIKFGGCQSCNNVMQYKEKTTRRHEMQNFAIQPD